MIASASNILKSLRYSELLWYKEISGFSVARILSKGRCYRYSQFLEKFEFNSRYFELLQFKNAEIIFATANVWINTWTSINLEIIHRGKCNYPNTECFENLKSSWNHYLSNQSLSKQPEFDPRCHSGSTTRCYQLKKLKSAQFGTVIHSSSSEWVTPRYSKNPTTSYSLLPLSLFLFIYIVKLPARNSFCAR